MWPEYHLNFSRFSDARNREMRSNIETSDESCSKFHRPSLAHPVSSPSTSNRRNSYCDASDRSSLRRSSTSDSDYIAPPFCNSLRQSSNNVHHNSSDVYSEHPQIRTKSNNVSPRNNFTENDESSNRGYMSLRRKKSSKYYLNDKVQY